MLWFLIFSIAAAYPATLPKHPHKLRFSHDRLKASTSAAPLEVSKKYVSLRKTNITAASSQRLHTAIRANGAAPLIPTEGGVGYAVDVNFAGTTLQLIVDTGSSDTWVPSTSLACLDQFGQQIPVAHCDFGPLYSGSFPEGTITDENFSISYGDGEIVAGTLGYADVSVAGVDVQHQEVAIADLASWVGDGQTSGLLGLAYPAITNAFQGDDPNEDTSANHVPYDPIVTTAGKQNLFTSFSLAIERGTGGSGGYLAFGGLPPIDFSQTFASTPIEVTTLGDVSSLSYYSITPDGFKIGSAGGASAYGAQTVASDGPLIVDSGTTIMYLPQDLADKVNAAFAPPAQYLDQVGGYEVECSATPPSFAVTIGGMDFDVSGQDLLLTGEAGMDPSTGLCITGVQTAYDGPAILGDTFLHNVVAVFDVGAGEMRFAAHENY